MPSCHREPALPPASGSAQHPETRATVRAALPAAMVSLGIALLMLAGAGLPGVGYATENNREAELQQLRREMGTERSRIGAGRERIRKLRDALARSEKQASVVRWRMRKIAQELAEKNRVVARHAAERDAMSATLTGLRNQLGQELRTNYANNRRDFLKLLLRLDDASHTARALAYQGYVSKARSDRIDRLRQDIADIFARERTAREDAARLAVLSERAEAAQTQLLAERRRRQQLVGELESELQASRARLEELRAHEQALASVFDRVERTQDELGDAAFAEVKSFVTSRGKYHWPTRGRLAKPYSTRTAPDNLHWQGVFIRAPMAQPVYSLAPGRVAFADWIRGFGQVVIVEHGDGFMSLYGHLSELIAEPGAWIDPDDVIGAVGDSGGQSEPGLYFEIRKDGAPQSPRSWCQGRPRNAPVRVARR